MKNLLALRDGGRVWLLTNFGGEILELPASSRYVTLHSKNCSDLHRVGLWEAHIGNFSPKTCNPTL